MPSSSMRAVWTSCWGRCGPAGPLCLACSPSTCMRVSTTDVPPLLHFTKNFKHWDIAAVTARSATTRGRFVPSALRQPEGRYRRFGGLPHGCCDTEDSLTDDEQIGRGQVLASCPHLEATAGYVTSFAEMLTERRGKQLNSWLSAVSADDHPARVSLRLRARYRSGSGQERADAFWPLVSNVVGLPRMAVSSAIVRFRSRRTIWRSMLLSVAAANGFGYWSVRATDGRSDT